MTVQQNCPVVPTYDCLISGKSIADHSFEGFQSPSGILPRVTLQCKPVKFTQDGRDVIKLPGLRRTTECRLHSRPKLLTMISFSAVTETEFQSVSKLQTYINGQWTFSAAIRHSTRNKTLNPLQS